MTALTRPIATLIMLVGLLIALTGPGRAADPDRLETFLQVTGFDVALESIRLSADSAPDMIGLRSDDFGSAWTRLVREVFDTSLMHEMAKDILSKTLGDDLLTHAVAFYDSDLGQRLVDVENASHMAEDDELKSESGEELVAAMARAGSPRLGMLKRLNAAAGSIEHSLRAIQEVQVRFLMAAASAGVIELRMEEPDLREALKAQEGEMRRSMQVSSLADAAYTYQAFSDAEVVAYAEALEDPQMQQVYELMNAVQFEIMANRYEAVARRLTGMQPSQDI